MKRRYLNGRRRTRVSMFYQLKARVNLRSPPLEQLQLSVVKSGSEGKHLRQLEVRGHQTADRVSGITETQRRVHTLYRRVH